MKAKGMDKENVWKAVTIVTLVWGVIVPPSVKEKVKEVQQNVFDTTVAGVHKMFTPHVSPVFLHEEPELVVWYSQDDYQSTEAVLPDVSSTSVIGSGASVFVTGDIDVLV